MASDPQVYNLETFDTHLQSLQSTLQFFTSALAASHQDQGDETFVNESDLIGLKGRTGMLVDDMLRVRKRVRGGGETAQEKKKARLSIEGSKNINHTSHSNSHFSPGNSTSSPHHQPPHPTPSQPAYQPHYLDVTEEVNRRLQESRLRALRDHSSTAQKRKREDDVGWDTGDGGEAALEAGLFSPVKKVKSAGEFMGEVMGMGVGVGFKRSGDGDDDGGANGMGTGIGNGIGNGGREKRGHVKRRRKM